ncbi:MAG: LysR family transcriptional regulator [Myxococcales bacterium]
MTNWNDLRFFIAVARTGTLAGAAKALKVDQTTVGRRLGLLEEALGTRLFTRAAEGFLLTAAGERAFAIARDLDERVGLLEASVHGEDARPEGNVRIAMNEHFSVGFFLERLVRVRDAYPGLTLEVVTEQRSVNLLRREADLAIRIAPRALPEQQGLVVRKLGTIALALYADRGYLDARPPLDLDAKLRGHDVIGYEQEIAEAPPGRWLAEHASQARRVLTVNSLLGAAAAASAGTGLAVLPCMLSAKYPSLVRALPGALATSEAWLLVHPELHATARVRAVVEHVVAEVDGARGLLSGED